MKKMNKSKLIICGGIVFALLESIFLSVLIVDQGEPKGKIKQTTLDQVKDNQQSFNNLSSDNQVILKANELAELPVIQMRTPAIIRAQQSGAKAKLTFRVRDSEGNPVSNAFCSVSFYTGRNDSCAEGLSNKEGMFTAEGRSVSDATYTIKKSGYYDTFTSYLFIRQSRDCVKDEKWVPWNPIIEVTLKEKRNPIPMYYKQSELIIIPKNTEVGYDFEKGACVKPHGKGEYSDIKFIYDSECKTWYDGNITNQLVVMGADEFSGFYNRPKEKYSLLISDYRAVDHGYVNRMEFHFKRIAQRTINNTKPKENEYFIFKTRPRLINGERVYHYGKLYELDFNDGTKKNSISNGVVYFTYFFNPTPNDTNLEFDWNKNLFEDPCN